MAKRLEDNGLWESSRMMLPEHKEAILYEAQVAKIRSKPVLDEQEWEIIQTAIAESLHDKTEISLRLYDEYEDLQLIGVVERVMGDRIRMDGEWFAVDRIVGVDLNS